MITKDEFRHLWGNANVHTAGVLDAADDISLLIEKNKDIPENVREKLGDVVINLDYYYNRIHEDMEKLESAAMWILEARESVMRLPNMLTEIKDRLESWDAKMKAEEQSRVQICRAIREGVQTEEE